MTPITKFHGRDIDWLVVVENPGDDALWPKKALPPGLCHRSSLLRKVIGNLL